MAAAGPVADTLADVAPSLYSPASTGVVAMEDARDPLPLCKS